MSTYMNTYVSFIVVGEISYPQKRSLRVDWYQAIRVDDEVKILHERDTMLRYTHTDCLVHWSSHRFMIYIGPSVWAPDSVNK